MISIKYIVLSMIMAFAFEMLQEVALSHKNKALSKPPQETERFVHIIVYIIHCFVSYAIVFSIYQFFK